MIERLLPSSVRVGEALADRSDVVLYPEESAAIIRAVDQRRREFTAVRGCARDALNLLGVQPLPIVPGPGGAPGWPPGVVGSMTHCIGYRGAVVARSADLGAVGIDAEPNEPLPVGVLDMFSVPEERSRLAKLDGCGVCPDTLLLCAKEAAYKAWFPLTGRFLDFREICVTLRHDGTFTAEVRGPGPAATSSWPYRFAGRWLVGASLVLTATSAPADR